MTEADSVLSGAVDSVKPWTIKSVATETRDLMIIAARKEGLTVGQWLDRRARAWSEGEAAPVLALPAPAVCPGPTALEAAAQAAAIVRELSGIPGLPESVRRLALSVLRDHLRAARR